MVNKPPNIFYGIAVLFSGGNKKPGAGPGYGEVGMSDTRLTRDQLKTLVEQVFGGDPMFVLQDADGKRYIIKAGTGLWWEDDSRTDDTPVQMLENNMLVKLNGLFGTLIELSGLKPDPEIEPRADLVADLRTFQACRSELAAVLNNVAIAKQYMVNGDHDRAIERMDWALSWSIRLLGVYHPAIGEMAPGQDLSLLTITGSDQ